MSKFILILLISLSVVGCNTNSTFSGDYYKTDLNRVGCFYNYDNKVFTSRNGTCSFTVDMVMGVRSNNKSFLLLISSLTSSNGYSWLYDIDKNNVKELTNFLNNFVAWEKLPESERIKQAEKFNSSSLATNKIAALDKETTYTFINKSSDKAGYGYENKPVLMIYRPTTYLGISNSSAWLMTSEDVQRILTFINRQVIILNLE
ncbi:hypothetical protein ACY2L5_001036 [Providencia rettgeri]